MYRSRLKHLEDLTSDSIWPETNFNMPLRQASHDIFRNLLINFVLISLNAINFLIFLHIIPFSFKLILLIIEIGLVK